MATDINSLSQLLAASLDSRQNKEGNNNFFSFQLFNFSLLAQQNTLLMPLTHM